MRPISRFYTPTGLNATGFSSNVTGATWPLTATEVGDGLAHQVTIHGDAATDHSLKTAVITGSDADGRTQTETVALPNGATTVTSTKYFKVVTSVVPSATIGADTMDIGWNNLCATPTVVCDPYRKSPPRLTVTVTGTINFTGEECFENILGEGVTPAFFAITALTSKTANTSGSSTGACIGLRVTTASFTAGATFTLLVSHLG